MWRVLRRGWNTLVMRRHRRIIENALALNRRGEVRSDGLRLSRVHSRLDIEWRARDVHPWNRDLPAEQRWPMFIEQSLADTEAAVSRLFDAFPQVDVIELRVLEPSSEIAIMEGTVHRSTLNRDRRLLSVKMRVLALGINYRLVGSHFQSLNSSYDEDALSMVSTG
jgi:hypothetical protein